MINQPVLFYLRKDLYPTKHCLEKFYYNYATSYRKKRILSYQLLNDKLDSILSEMVLFYGLMACGIKIQPNIVIKTSDLGKPFLSDMNVKFNISHDLNGIICGISPQEIGVDIQHYVKLNKESLKLFCTLHEYKNLNNEKNDYIKLWAIKESYLKAIGTGLLADSRNYDFTNCFKNDSFFKDNFYFDIFNAYDSIISVCSVIKLGSIINLTINDIEEFVRDL